MAKLTQQNADKFCQSSGFQLTAINSHQQFSEIKTLINNLPGNVCLDTKIMLSVMILIKMDLVALYS
jgi:hypothetical protein